MENGKRRPSPEEVIARLKDDGDFDSLRVKIIRKVKENEELRSTIVSEVKQSVVLNEEGSKKLKLRQVSDAIYEELGSKIMAQISDEVWKVIKSCENDIKGTVESVYDRIVNPEAKKRDSSSPTKELLTNGKDHASALAHSSNVMNVPDGNEQVEIPPGFGTTDQQSNKSESAVVHHDEQPQLSHNDFNHQEQVAAMPPGFGPAVDSAIFPGGINDEDPDLPPGFG